METEKTDEKTEEHIEETNPDQQHLWEDEKLHDPLADEHIVEHETLWQRIWGMDLWHKAVVFGGLFLLFLLIIYKIFFQANFSRTVYVDATVRTSGNGSFARPIKDLQTAIDQYNTINPSSELDILLAGEHVGSFELPELTRITGREGDATTIVGTLVTGREAILTDFRVTGDGAGIVVPDGHVVIMEGLDISDNDDHGVDAGEETNIIVKNSQVKNNAAEGISASARSRAEIVDTEVSGNTKEGVDFEAGVKGTLTNNVITDNGQSGVEYILGESIGVLRSNIIERNGGSGVTVQFSADYPLLGNVEVVDNVISNNREFGVACEKPGKGDRPERYYDNSTRFEFNEVRGNQNDPIAKKCGFKL